MHTADSHTKLSIHQKILLAKETQNEKNVMVLFCWKIRFVTYVRLFSIGTQMDSYFDSPKAHNKRSSNIFGILF